MHRPLEQLQVADVTCIPLQSAASLQDEAEEEGSQAQLLQRQAAAAGRHAAARGRPKRGGLLAAPPPRGLRRRARPLPTCPQPAGAHPCRVARLLGSRGGHQALRARRCLAFDGFLRDDVSAPLACAGSVPVWPAAVAALAAAPLPRCGRRTQQRGTHSSSAPQGCTLTLFPSQAPRRPGSWAAYPSSAGMAPPRSRTRPCPRSMGLCL